MPDARVNKILQAQQWARQQGLEAIDADLLLAFVLGQSRTWLFTWPERALNDDQQRRFGDVVRRRLAGEPVAHILGTREFWSLPLKVNASTLIPRPETETLVEAILNRFDQPVLRVADMGTGTGAIALALASERPGWRISAYDVQADAVALAQENAQQLGLPVTVSQSHWCDALVDASVDLLVSNPPYIAVDDEHLQQGDVRFEPLTALVAAEDGLADIRLLIEQGQRVLVPGGWLFLEHGWTQGEAVRACFDRLGYGAVETVQDMGYRDRISFGQWNPPLPQSPNQ